MQYTPEEQAEHRKLWVEALRSGKYSQGENWLRTDRGYCCLGVACEISGLVTWRDGGPDHFRSVNTFEAISGTGTKTQELADDVRLWLGLADADGSIPGEESLASINDSGRPFTAIADIIEAEPEGLIAKAGA